MPKADIAKLFQNGRSQAVRLPQEFRFEGDRVRVRRLRDELPGAQRGQTSDRFGLPYDQHRRVAQSGGVEFEQVLPRAGGGVTGLASLSTS